MKNIIATLLFIVFGCTSSYAAIVEFSWDANTEADLAGYRLYQSTTSTQYTKGEFVAEIQKPAVGYTLADIADGKYFWVLTAFDTFGNESDWSNEVTFTIDETAPKPPSGFLGWIKKLISWLFGGLTVKG